jgi:hypothetical protein
MVMVMRSLTAAKAIRAGKTRSRRVSIGLMLRAFSNAQPLGSALPAWKRGETSPIRGQGSLIR